MYANNGLMFTTDDDSSSMINLYYPGRVGFLIEKAIAAWDWGKLEECYGIVEDLEENYEIPKEYVKDVEKNKRKKRWSFRGY
jgi:hypothetical protein